MAFVPATWLQNDSILPDWGKCNQNPARACAGPHGWNAPDLGVISSLPLESVGAHLKSELTLERELLQRAWPNL